VPPQGVVVPSALLDHVGDEPVLILTASGGVAWRRTAQAEHATRPPFRDAQTSAHPVDAMGEDQQERETRRTAKTPDWMAVQAVSSEPVSAAVSLINRENTGNFANSNPYLAHRHPTTY